MKQKTLIALVAALCLLSSVGPIQVFAENGDGSSGDEESRKSWLMPIRGGDMQEKRDERREAIKARLFERGDGETAKGMMHQQFGNGIMVRLGVFHFRLENIMKRVQVAIDKAETDGKDTDTAQEELDAARADLTKAQTLIETVKTQVQDTRTDLKAEFTGDDTRPDRDSIHSILAETRPELQADFREIKDLIKSAHMHMIAAVDALKSIRGEGEDEQEED